MESCGSGHIVMKMDVIGDGLTDQIGNFVYGFVQCGLVSFSHPDSRQLRPITSGQYCEACEKSDCDPAEK